jgi:4-amino-4-deoxy-L-arabinose transferase-like glycosyltransferase
MKHDRPFRTLPLSPHGRNVLLLFVVLLPLFFGRLSDLRLPMWDDLTHAAIGKEILVAGDWFTMHANGTPIFIKPPLYFWLEAGIFSLFGVSEYGARFPAALCGYLCAIFIYLLSRRLFGRKTAFLAILVTATSFLFIKYSRRAMLDVPVAFATTLGMYALVRAEKRSPFFLLYGLAIALGYYFKAVQGMYLVLIGPAYLLLSGQWRRLLNPWFLAANAGAAGLIALWAVPQALTNGDVFLRSQSALGPLLNRGLTDEPAPLFAPFLSLAQVFWPWIPLSAVGLFTLARKHPAARRTVLLFCWFFTVTAVLCISRSFFRRYLLPVVPVLIIAAAFALSGLLSRRRFSRVYRQAWVWTGIAVIPLQIFPVPLDNRGTDQIAVFQTMRHLTKASDQIVLFKGNHWTVGQGLSFYADRRLTRHFDDAGELARFLDTARTGVYGIANAADYAELRGRLCNTLVERARPDRYVIFEAPSAR